MSETEYALQLLSMAEKDLRAIEAMAENEAFATEIFGFHAQQAIEKALKAWIAVLGETHSFTHNIGTLLDELEGLGQDVERFGSLTLYTDFAVVLRYSGLESTDTPGDLDRPAAIAEVRGLLDHVRAIVAEVPDEDH